MARHRRSHNDDLFLTFTSARSKSLRLEYTEADVWAAALQIIIIDPEYPSITAARRADGLLDEGDMEGSAFWIRVTKALEEIERKAPRDGESVN